MYYIISETNSVCCEHAFLFDPESCETSNNKFAHITLGFTVSGV